MVSRLNPPTAGWIADRLHRRLTLGTPHTFPTCWRLSFEQHVGIVTVGCQTWLRPRCFIPRAAEQSRRSVRLRLSMAPARDVDPWSWTSLVAWRSAITLPRSAGSAVKGRRRSGRLLAVAAALTPTPSPARPSVRPLTAADRPARRDVHQPPATPAPPGPRQGASNGHEQRQPHRPPHRRPDACGTPTTARPSPTCESPSTAATTESTSSTSRSGASPPRPSPSTRARATRSASPAA